jgi:hypothetical protein
MANREAQIGFSVLVGAHLGALIIGAKARPVWRRMAKALGRQAVTPGLCRTRTRNVRCAYSCSWSAAGWPQTVQPSRRTVARSPVGLSAGPA